VEVSLLIKAAILGVVEGATEFLPVSSTGHLIVVADWLGFTGEAAKVFEIFIQLGAILAIVWLYRRRIASVIRTVPSEPRSRQFVLNLLIGFLPAAIVGLLFHDAIKRYLFNPVTVALAFVVGGIAILLIEHWRPAERIGKVDQVPPRTALGIGLAQVLSLIPGTSRSGATIMGAYCLGLSREAATEFSFFLAIPVMFAATTYDLLNSRHLVHAPDIPVFAVGFVFAFLSALLVVRAFLTYVSRRTFRPFAWYRIAVGLVLLVWYRHHTW
jgi:undecaprenyl-diphosphatase